jgi:hypothetical protein
MIMAELKLNQAGGHGAPCLSHLTSNQQFWWGALGGFIIVAFKLWFYTQTLTPDAPWPRVTFRTFLLTAFSVLFPLAAGFLSRACNPAYPLMAVFEGASTPALFLLLAKDLHL